MSKGDVIIIGSGLGGLSSGVILARNGYKVTVLEQGTQIGGCLQCFTRRGVKFETGMHFIGSADPGQTLHKLMRYIGLDGKIELSRLDTDGYDVIALGSDRFRFANGREAFIEQLAASFPDQRDNLARYFDVIDRVAAASTLHSLKYDNSDASVTTEYQLRSINEVIDSIITDPLLAKVLVGNLPLYAGQRDKTPFSTHAFIMDFYNQSSFRIVGGSDSIATALQHELERLGGEVRANAKVTRVICDDTKSTGVEINGAEFKGADMIISSIHPIRTLELIDSKLIRPIFRKRISSIPQTTGGFSVYIHFKDNTVPYMNSNFYGYNYNTPWDCELYDNDNWPKGYLYMHFCHEENPRWAKGGVILSYMNMADVERWRGTRIGHRGDDYEAFKRDKAQCLISSLERHFPGLSDSIKHIYTSSPLTYLDYTGTEGGSMYGIAKDITLGSSCRVPHRTRIPNLLLSGQNINSHGMLGVLVGSIVTCSELLTAPVVYQQINDANS